MRLSRIVFVALIVLLILGHASRTESAQAAETCEYGYTSTTVAESMCWGMPPGSTVVFESSRKGVWGARQFIRWLDPQLDGLTMIAKRRVQCDEVPGAYCIYIVKDAWNHSQYGGYAIPPTDEWYGYVELNTTAGRLFGSEYRRYVAAHEVLHSIGLSHHLEYGMMNDSLRLMKPSASEIELLQSWYN